MVKYEVERERDQERETETTGVGGERGKRSEGGGSNGMRTDNRRGGELEAEAVAVVEVDKEMLRWS